MLCVRKWLLYSHDTTPVKPPQQAEGQRGVSTQRTSWLLVPLSCAQHLLGPQTPGPSSLGVTSPPLSLTHVIPMAVHAPLAYSCLHPSGSRLRFGGDFVQQPLCAAHLECCLACRGHPGAAPWGVGG